MHNPWHRLPTHLKNSLKVILVVVGAGFVLDISTIIGFSMLHPVAPNKVDAVVILGAKVGTPALRNRTLAGLAYYQAGKTDTLVLSGAQGPGETVTEAKAMETIIKEQVGKTHDKLPRLILETKSTDTYQNISNSKALIPTARSVVIVSDGYHLERSVAIARRVGFQKVYWDSPKPTYYSGIALTYYYVREAIAIVAYVPLLI